MQHAQRKASRSFWQTLKGISLALVFFCLGSCSESKDSQPSKIRHGYYKDEAPIPAPAEQVPDSLTPPPLLLTENDPSPATPPKQNETPPTEVTRSSNPTTAPANPPQNPPALTEKVQWNDLIRAGQRLGRNQPKDSAQVKPGQSSDSRDDFAYDYDNIPFHASAHDLRRVWDYFSEQGQQAFSEQKIESLRKKVIERKKIALDYLASYYRNDPQQPLSREKAEEKSNQNHLQEIYKILLQLLEEIRTEKDQTKQIRKAVLWLEINDSIKSMGQVSPASYFFSSSLPSLAMDWKLNRLHHAENEAKNLYHPQSKRIYQTQDLQNLLRDQIDLSRLNPHPQSGIWRQVTDLSKIDVSENYYQPTKGALQGATLRFPQNAEATFTEILSTHSTPRLQARFKDEQGIEQQITLRFAREMHAEVTVAALLSTLGYSTAVSRYVRDFKLYLPAAMSPDQLKMQWMTYFTQACDGCPKDLFEVDRYIKQTGSDNKGSYIIFTEALMETVVPELLPVGPWSYSGNGHRDEREIRALLLFHLWVQNTDLRLQNNLMVMRKTRQGQYQPFYLQQNLGASLGDGRMSETPNRFNSDMIREADEESITFNYQSIHGADALHDDGHESVLEIMTYSDAKWMARLIGQLSRDQITAAVKLGGWPLEAEKIYVEKLIHRRNGLIKAFELHHRYSELEVPFYKPSNAETSALPPEREFSEMEVFTEILKSKIKNRLEGYTQDFDNFDSELINPMVSALKDTLISWGQRGLGAIGSIAVNLEEIGLNNGVVSHVIFNLSRDLVKNDNPSNVHDLYLLVDEFTIGLRLGYSLVLGADAAYYEKYTLIQPVRNSAEKTSISRGVVDLALPFKVRGTGGLPKHYSLMVEKYFEARGRIKLEDLVGGFSPIGAQGSISHFNVYRSLMQRKINGDMIIYGDSRRYLENGAKVYFNLAFAQLPFYKYTHQYDGKLSGEMRIIKNATLSRYGKSLFDLVETSVDSADFTPLYPYAQLVTVKSEYEETSSEFNMLGIFYWGHHERTDKISLEYDLNTTCSPQSGQMQSNGKIRRDRIQHRSDRTAGWAFPFCGSEDRLERTETMGDALDDFKRFKDPTLRLHFFMDDTRTDSDELGLGYVSFLNSLVVNQINRVSYLPAEDSRTGHFGNVVLRANLFYSSDGMKKILDMNSEDFWRLFAQENRMSETKLRYYRHRYYSDIDPDVKKPGYSFSSSEYPDDFDDSVERGYEFLKNLKNAHALFDQNPVAAAKSLVEAMETLVFKKGEYLDGTLLGALNAYVGLDHFYFWGEIFTPRDQKNHLLAGRDLRISDGLHYPKPMEAFIVLNPQRPNDQYHMFDWVDAL